MVLLICGIASCVTVFAQDTADVAKLEAEIAARKAKLTDAAIATGDREKTLREIASLFNHIGEIGFANGEYELATKAFVEADASLKQYHESAYAKAKADLDDAEKRLTAFENDPNPETRPMRVKMGLSYVGSVLSMVFSEARSLDDETGKKKALTRLGEIARADGDLSREAESYEKIGQMEFNAGNSQAAFELFAKAQELRKKAGKDEYWAIDYIAYARWSLGEYDKAIELFKQEVELTRKTNAEPEEAKPGTSELTKQSIKMERSVIRSSLTQALLNIAQIYALTGKYGEAHKAVDEVQPVIVQMKAEEEAAEESLRPLLTVSRASVEGNVARMRGRLLEAKGDESAAAKSFLEAADIFSQLSGGNPSGAVASIRSRLAMIYSNQGKFDEARANIREAMRIRSRLHQESAATYALMQASRIELADKKVDAALKLARQSKGAAIQLSLDDVLAEASEVESDALIAKAPDASSLMLEQAIVGYKTAIENYRRMEFRPFLMRALNSLAVAYERAGRTKDAEIAYQQAVEVAESIRTSFLSSEESESYSNRRDVTAIYQRLIDLLVKQGRAEEALQYATRAQRRDLIDAVPKSEIHLDSKSSAALKQVNTAELKEQAARSNLAQSRGDSSAGSAVKKNSLASAVGAARQDYALAIKRLEIDQPNLRFTVRPTDLLKLQATMSPTEAIVSYLVTPERLYIFVVRKGAVAVRNVEISQNDLRALIAETRDGLTAFSEEFYDISADADKGFATEKTRADLRKDDNSEHYKKNLAPINKALRSLDQKLIEPVDDLLAGAETLKLIPNAELFLLPFGALISAKKGDYLLQRYNLTYATAGDLITSPSKVAPNGMLLAFGDPTEANLDGALEEVKAIQKVFPRSQLFLEDKATKEQLFKLTSAKILHFATHGHIKIPIESSTIQLAHLPALSDPDLSYGEIYALPLETSDMIVLSACQTALGAVSGTEVGVFIEAFRTKTNTVAASLWSVDDFATRELMVEFYKNLAAGQTRAAALRTAQLKLLKDGRTKNPLFWAAFVMYGDGGRLTGIPAPVLKASAR